VGLRRFNHAGGEQRRGLLWLRLLRRGHLLSWLLPVRLLQRGVLPHRRLLWRGSAVHDGHDDVLSAGGVLPG
jgi:hypothetical protein